MSEAYENSSFYWPQLNAVLSIGIHRWAWWVSYVDWFGRYAVLTSFKPNSVLFIHLSFSAKVLFASNTQFKSMLEWVGHKQQWVNEKKGLISRPAGHLIFQQVINMGADTSFPARRWTRLTPVNKSFYQSAELPVWLFAVLKWTPPLWQSIMRVSKAT